MTLAEARERRDAARKDRRRRVQRSDAPLKKNRSRMRPLLVMVLHLHLDARIDRFPDGGDEGVGRGTGVPGLG